MSTVPQPSSSGSKFWPAMAIFLLVLALLSWAGVPIPW